MNPLYQQLMGQSVPQQRPAQQPMSGGPQFMNPMQKMNYIMQAMRNPAAFVKQAIPDLPDQIANDPNQVLNYIMQTRNITQEQVNQIARQVPKF